MKKISVVYTGSFQFPEGMAGTKRVKNLILHDNSISNVLLISNSGRNKKLGIDKETTYCTIFRSKKKILNIIFSLPYIIFGFVKLINLFKKGNYKNILYIYSGINIENIILVIVAKVIGYKIVVDVVEDFSLNEEKVSKWRAIKLKSNIFFENKYKNIADGIVVISHYLKDKFNQSQFKSIPIIHLPVSASNIDIDIKSPSNYYESGVFYLLYSGTYGKKDGFEYILDAFENIVQDNKNIRLVLTGNIPEYIKHEISSRKLNSFIIFTGFLKEKEYYNLLSGSDILLMTRINSKYANAGFPYKLGEYLASGTPVIATKVSDVDKYLTDDLNAFLIEPNDSQGIVNAIKKITNDFNMAKKIGLNGREISSKYFNPIIHRKQLHDFLLKI